MISFFRFSGLRTLRPMVRRSGSDFAACLDSSVACASLSALVDVDDHRAEAAAVAVAGSAAATIVPATSDAATPAVAILRARAVTM